MNGLVVICKLVLKIVLVFYPWFSFLPIWKLNFPITYLELRLGICPPPRHTQFFLAFSFLADCEIKLRQYILYTRQGVKFFFLMKFKYSELIVVYPDSSSFVKQTCHVCFKVLVVPAIVILQQNWFISQLRFYISWSWEILTCSHLLGISLKSCNLGGALQERKSR